LTPQIEYQKAHGRLTVGELPEGADALVFTTAARKRGGRNVFIARDDTRAANFKAACRFLAPDIDLLELPAWDCLPFDSDDPIYAAVTEGVRPAGVEHWLPLFYPELETVFDYIGAGALYAFDSMTEEARAERTELIDDYYDARDAYAQTQKKSDGGIHRALPADRLYLQGETWDAATHALTRRDHSVFAVPQGDYVINIGAAPARSFAAERQTEGVNVFDEASKHIKSLRDSGQKVWVASWTQGSSERLGSVLNDHGLLIGEINNGTAAREMRPDLVIHIDHGLGRYLGLRTIDVQSQPHDVLELEYAKGAKLFLPVENIELLSRYGSAPDSAILDTLGAGSWNARKNKAKQRLRDMAEELIKIAAKRALRTAEPMEIAPGIYDEFCARFPYAETDDQLNAIDDVTADLKSGKPMDRLICGDVGFGKTEVALRAAFIAVMSGKQVAVVAPTTVLARQHFKTFADRFRGWPVKVRQLSRLVSTKDANAAREELANGRCEIIIGTHALLAKSVSFSDLGLLIVDEEQRFGVQHKERLKALRADVHVLTLTATPIPRTLQMALSGIRDLSLIATPPVDRLAAARLSLLSRAYRT